MAWGGRLSVGMGCYVDHVRSLFNQQVLVSAPHFGFPFAVVQLLTNKDAAAARARTPRLHFGALLLFVNATG